MEPTGKYNPEMGTGKASTLVDLDPQIVSMVQNFVDMRMSHELPARVNEEVERVVPLIIHAEMSTFAKIFTNTCYKSLKKEGIKKEQIKKILEEGQIASWRAVDKEEEMEAITISDDEEEYPSVKGKQKAITGVKEEEPGKEGEKDVQMADPGPKLQAEVEDIQMVEKDPELEAGAGASKDVAAGKRGKGPSAETEPEKEPPRKKGKPRKERAKALKEREGKVWLAADKFTKVNAT